MALRYRRLYGTGQEVSEIGVGLWSLVTDEWGARSHLAEDLLRMAYNMGINFFDTADVYGKGAGEEAIARALGSKRDDIIVLTKIGLDFYGCNGIRPHYDIDYLELALDRSLERLGMGYVDILLLHNPPMHVIVSSDVREFMSDVKRSGKAKLVGVALGPTLGWGAEGEAALRLGYQAIEHIFNVIERLPGAELLNFEAAHIIRVPHASDVLDEERWPLEPQTNLHRNLKDSSWIADAMEAMKPLLDLARLNGMKLYELAIKYVLSYRRVGSVVPNITSRHDLERFVRSVELQDLNNDVLEIINKYWEDRLKELNLRSLKETELLKYRRSIERQVAYFGKGNMDRPGFEPGASAVRGRRSSS